MGRAGPFHASAAPGSSETSFPEPVLIRSPHEYVEVSTDECSVILKIHGSCRREAETAEGDSYVITEDHYIDYLTGGTELASLIPVKLAKQLRHSALLFLGYGLDDWNLRVILNRIWREGRPQYRSWAIQRDPPLPVDEAFWERREVEILAVDLRRYVDALSRRFERFQRALL